MTNNLQTSLTCPDCNSYVVFETDDDNPGVIQANIFHDETCPQLAELQEAR